jgi:hypothetical protein
MATHPERLFLIAGAGRYPALVIEEARRAGVGHISMAAFEGETARETAAAADAVTWLRVGQLGRLLDAARSGGCRHAIMAGQLAPKNLFDLRPDLKALVLLAKLRQRNAETLFGAVADQLGQIGVELLPATSFLESHLATEGRICGATPKPRLIEDMQFGFRIAREMSRLDVGQSVVVRAGTVLAVEAFEGTDACMARGGALGRGKAVLVKVSKPGQDMRFDVPVIGEQTIVHARAAGIAGIALEAGRTLLLDRAAVTAAAGILPIHGLRAEDHLS